MSKSLKYLLPVAFIITLALAFCFVQPVFAQDELPPTETPLEETLTEVQVEPPVETPLEETPVETPTDPPPEDPAATEDPVEPPAEGDPLEEAPAEIVLVDETGEPLSLASQEAADILGGDPYFMAGGVYYGFSTTGICPAIVPAANCTASATPIQAAIDDFKARHATGAITVEAGTYSETIIYIDAVPGLTGLIGAGSDTNFPTTILNGAGVHIVIQNQAASFTLRGFRMDGISFAGALIHAENNVGTLTLDDLFLRNTGGASGDAIYIPTHTGNVVITNVEADRNGGNGARISATGSVTITNSSFDRNAGSHNLQVTSHNSSILLNNVSASLNVTGDGAYLLSKTGITVRNSVFYANNTFGLCVNNTNRGNILIDNTIANNNNSSSDGLRLNTLSGTVTLTNVQASSNAGMGVVIDTCQFNGSACTGSGAVMITNGAFTGNALGNLNINANGAITLNTVEGTSAWQPGAWGAYLGNHLGTVASAITVTHGTFDYNSGNNAWGLYIQSKGIVTLNHVSAHNNNSGGGIYIENSFGTGSVSILATQGTNSAYSNDGTQPQNAGLYVLSRGAVTVNSLSATNNSGRNIYINNISGIAGVTITTASVSGNQVAFGLEIYSNGLISLTGVEAGGNPNGGGIYLSNAGSPSKAGVTIKNSGSQSNNANNVEVNTLGPVTITNLNTGYSATGSGLVISGAAGAISITGGTHENNNQYGVYITSGGAVTIKDIITMFSTNQSGMRIDNTYTTSSPAVSITNLESRSNGGYGLQVDSRGQINLTTFSIHNNGTSTGVLLNTLGGVAVNSMGGRSTIYNHTGTNLAINATGIVTVSNIDVSYSSNGYGIWVTTNGAVSVSNASSTGNYANNIDIVTNGNITLNNVDSSSSVTGYGAYLTNNPGTGGITISGGSTSDYNDFSYNVAGGIIANTNGALTFSNVMARENRNGNPGTSGFGISLNNTNTGNVTMTNIWVSYHPYTGILIQSVGTVTLTNITGERHHSGDNLFINNTYATTPRAVTINGLYLTFAGASGVGDGVEIRSNGAITVSNFNISDNPHGYSMYLDNTTGSGGVTLSGPSIAVPSTAGTCSLEGIYIATNGAVSIIRVNASNAHGSGGIVISNTGGTYGVTLTNVNSYSNDRHGIWIRTNGSVTMNTVSASSNGAVSTLGNGILITNTGTGTVSLTNLNLNNNYLDNLRVTSLRQITINGVNSRWSTTGSGLSLNNASGTGGVSVSGSTITPNDIYNNSLTGIYILTNGDVTLQNTLSYYSTNGRGAYIDNYNGGSGTGKVTITNVSSQYNYAADAFFVRSNGVISVTGSNATSGVNGFNLNNDLGAATPAGITITNSTSFGVSQIGFNIFTRGNVTLSLVTANNCANGGVAIDYNNASITAVTSISRSTFNSNGGTTGLFVLDGGNVTLNSITAQSNYNGHGVYINNSAGGSLGTVTMLASYGPNRFIGNSGGGLYVISNGAVTLTNIIANQNALEGLYVDNDSGNGKVIVTGGTLNQNSRQGAYIFSNNTVTLSNLNVFSNGFSGDREGISVTTSADAVTIQNSQIIGNGRYGINANIGALLTVSKCNYFGNNQSAPNDNDPNILLQAGTTLLIVR